MSIKKNEWVILEDENGEAKRYNLASMQGLTISLPQDAWGTGVSLEDVFYMPRKRRIIIHTFSVWENPRTHGCYGDGYYLADKDTIARLARLTGNEIVMSLVEEGDV